MLYPIESGQEIKKKKMYISTIMFGVTVEFGFSIGQAKRPVGGLA